MLFRIGMYALFLIVGVCIGAFAKIKIENITRLQKMQMAFVYILILTMGIKIGIDRVFIDGMLSVGLLALGFSLFTLCGSVLMIFILNKTILKNNNIKK